MFIVTLITVIALILIIITIITSNLKDKKIITDIEKQSRLNIKTNTIVAILKKA